jgi:Spy/CpxP family protein refolding chaperone
MRSIQIRTIVSSVLAVTFLSVAVPAIVRAQIPDGGPAVDTPFGRPGGPARLLGPLFPIVRRLQLAPDQRGQIRQILLGHREDFRNLIQRAVQARKALFSAVYLDPFDEGVIRDRSADVAAVQADEAVLRATIRTEIFGVLTPDQLARAIKALQRFEQHGRDGSDDASSPL